VTSLLKGQVPMWATVVNFIKIQDLALSFVPYLRTLV
jgi:hypothetical protein